MAEQGSLRWGYSTGACATALALALWHQHTAGALPKAVEVLFPDGQVRSLGITSLPEQSHCAALYKDGGDDPDCTHGALLYASFQPCATHEAGEHDYVLPVGKAVLIVRAGEGIGLCTRPGLDCDCGKWAINTAPRAMIARNLVRAGMHTGCWLLVLNIRNGMALAQKTLNAHLGIVGGLSILGTTGLVRPFSHAAYQKTIWLCTRSHALSGGRHIVFCTGGRTLRGAKATLSQLPPSAFVCIADFIGESLRAAVEFAMHEVSIACMAGKICKYAAGFDNTHAHTVAQDMGLFRHELHSLCPACAALPALQAAASVREALLLVPQQQRKALLQRLAALALAGFAQKFPTVRVQVLLFDFEGKLLFVQQQEH